MAILVMLAAMIGFFAAGIAIGLSAVAIGLFSLFSALIVVLSFPVVVIVMCGTFFCQLLIAWIWIGGVLAALLHIATILCNHL